MKKYLLVMTIVLSLILSACSSEQLDQSNIEDVQLKSISTSELKEKLDDSSWVLVDTRSNDEFNGWRLNGIKRGGHIPNAVDFSANWLRVDVENKEKILDETLKNKGIDKDKNIVLYCSNQNDSLKVANYLSQKGYENIYIYDVNEWANDESLPMEKYKNYHLIVPPSIVKDILDGKTPETFENAKQIKIVEASWGDEDASYSKGHVPTAFHINTDLVEPPPTWMLADDKQLTQFALEYGFTKDDTVIVTGENQMAAYRVAVVLRYMGVEDVRVLNGGLLAWKLAGYDVETTSNYPTPVSDFGSKIPANPSLITTIDQVKENLTKNEFILVDNRTWDEHIGKSSGYSYHDKKGRIPNSFYGYAGLKDSNSLDYYRNIDNTMRNFKEILALWEDSGIDINKHLAFMCGSGWRAAEVLTYAQVMGLENTSLYSDGWIGWSNDPSNPIETGEPK
ncbi:thiosulfate/3-mercaptopyruvate sulfurtransferase [Alkalithermobacter thermoalcaliphilus JW-YL-7 = DSM 7308]|uniref:Rhodanese-like protein n=1 Tax=Alkalithermobacter thermoalcaliphilus JW-YL-7 = DSM 7308 TaxID=1121328 RepID=A0A150FSW4_CLOPD|nr:Rhodanese-like protein [[Clostridium] paradoxum JW-YL-7 = DSM 7308]SHL34073.1 thiosulfate/3-mercaptopyruvate sulfurtransferase [[Clostridium] paradoxum JW-YL-7 = DSM 7308]